MLQSVFGELSLRDVTGETSAMDKLPLLPKDVCAHLDVFDRAVLAAQPGIVVMQCFSAIKPRENVVDRVGISVKLRDVMAQVFLTFVAQQLEFGPICAQNNSVLSNPMETNGGIFKK